MRQQSCLALWKKEPVASSFNNTPCQPVSQFIFHFCYSKRRQLRRPGAECTAESRKRQTRRRKFPGPLYIIITAESLFFHFALVWRNSEDFTVFQDRISTQWVLQICSVELRVGKFCSRRTNANIFHRNSDCSRACTVSIP